MCRQPFLLKIHTHSGIPHYNDLKMLYAVYPLHKYTSLYFALSLAFPPAFHTLHFISGYPILSTAMEDELLATTSPVLQMLNEKIDVLTLSPTERKLYESRMKLKSDITTISETQFSAGVERGKSLGLAEGKSLGLAEGKSLGLAEGSRLKALETAAAFKRLGFDIAKIAEGTGLSVEEIKAL